MRLATLPRLDDPLNVVAAARHQHHLPLWRPQREVSVAADHPLLPASQFECGSRSIIQTSPLKSPSTRTI